MTLNRFSYEENKTFYFINVLLSLTRVELLLDRQNLNVSVNWIIHSFD